MSIIPEGEQFRKAIEWISNEHSERPKESLLKLTQEACFKFDLSSKDTETLMHLIAGDFAASKRKDKSE